MADYITYSTADRTGWIYQPQVTRWRHRFRGVRESLKFNQEIGQTSYDLYRFNARIQDLIEDEDARHELLLLGFYYGPGGSNAEFVYAGVDSDTEVLGLDSESIVLVFDHLGSLIIYDLGLIALTDRLGLLENRIRELENNHV